MRRTGSHESKAICIVKWQTAPSPLPLSTPFSDSLHPMRASHLSSTKPREELRPRAQGEMGIRGSTSSGYTLLGTPHSKRTLPPSGLGSCTTAGALRTAAADLSFSALVGTISRVLQGLMRGGPGCSLSRRLGCTCLHHSLATSSGNKTSSSTFPEPLGPHQSTHHVTPDGAPRGQVCAGPAGPPASPPHQFFPLSF